MRKAFVKTLIQLAEADDRILLLSADLGYSILEPFIDKYPRRFFNVGVAEQNMVGMATGLAEAGYIPFVYSMVSFVVLRPYEFIRNGPILHRLSVRLVGVGGGFDYGTAGPTHYGLEDLGVLRVQPGIEIYCPADAHQARNVIRSTWDRSGPIYYRLGKDDQTVISSLDGRFRMDRVERIGEGNDVLLVTTGGIAPEAVEASSVLTGMGVACSTLIVSSIQPAPIDDLRTCLQRAKWVVTIENHYLNGGLGSLMAELISESGLRVLLKRLGAAEGVSRGTGDAAYLHKASGLSRDQIVAEVFRFQQTPPNL